MRTVWDLLQGQARISWTCDVEPAHRGDVDLNRVLEAKGCDFTLANRKPPCPAPGCPGRVTFMDRSGSWPKPLDTIGDRDPAWWDYTERRRAELLALGWRMVMGKWVAPGRGPQ